MTNFLVFVLRLYNTATYNHDGFNVLVQRDAKGNYAVKDVNNNTVRRFTWLSEAEAYADVLTGHLDGAPVDGWRGVNYPNAYRSPTLLARGH